MHKIKSITHIKLILLIAFVVLLTIPFLLFQLSSDDENYFLFFLVGVVLFFILILLYVHLEYFFTNLGLSIQVDHIRGILIFNKQNREEIVYFDQIVEIQHHKSATLTHNSKRRVLPTDDYHYSKIILNDKRKFYVTSLLWPGFTLNMPSKEKVVKRVVALIVLENSKTSSK